MSHVDERIRGEVWDGRIPIMFVLATNEVSTVQSPPPYFEILPRLGYFAFVTKKIQQHFSSYTILSQQQDIWFESEDQPLRWHLPIGVVFDSLNTGRGLPWVITVHFRNFPISLLHCGTVEEMEWCYMNSLKEAMSLRFGNAKAVMGLSKESQKQLFEGLAEHNFRKFWSVNQLLIDHESSGSLKKYVPIRFVFRHLRQSYVQKPIPITDSEGAFHTLRSSLNILIPQLIPVQQTQLNSDNSSNEKQESGVTCIVHGQLISLDTPLAWIMDHCCHGDDFIYVIISISATAFVECLSGTFG